MSHKNSALRLALRSHSGHLGGQVASGVKWHYGFTAFRVAITIGSTAVLARLLSPGDYGLVAMSTLVTEFAALFANLGFGAILVQQPKLTRRQLDTVFCASVIIGLVLAFLVAAAAYPAAALFKQPELTAVLCVSALSFVVQGVAVVPAAILQRLLMFKAEVLLQASLVLLRTGLAVGLALAGAGYWSLVIGGVVALVCVTAVQFVVVGFRPRWRLDTAFLRQHARSSGSFLGSGLLSHLNANIDYFVVGRRFGAAELGLYQVAFSLPEELRTRLSGPLQRVLFPAYARLQSEPQRFRDAVLESQRLLAYVVLPLGAVMAVLAPEIVAVLYGPKWADVVPLLQVLAVGGACRAMFSLVASVFYATGRADLAFKINLISAPFLVLAVVAGSQWGALGVAWAMLLVNVTSVWSVSVSMRLIGLGLSDFLIAITRPVVTALLAAAAAALLHWLLIDFSAIPAVLLVSCGVMGLVTGGLAALVLDPALGRRIGQLRRPKPVNG